MNNKVYYQFIGILMAFLVVSFPVTGATELNLIYDPNGNLVTGDGFYRVYNSINQLWKVYNGTSDTNTMLEEYSYHPWEERTLNA
ncbi:hypothetical protein HYV84_03805 [Candidatus Woesearchaeota archaeon]|nr:hypothetical protein [Candidatus Woesearchaeota archaeon]